MGLLDEVAKGLSGAIATGAAHPEVVNAVLDHLGNKNSGGLAGLVQTFESKGLGDVIQSWVGSGPNLPISAEQIQQVLGSSALTQLAQKAGVSPQVAASTLASVLPTMVDKLSPGGTIQHELLQDGLNLLKTRLAAQK
jgi:uncharacterized protein YidB (DUF937 family)